MSFFKPKNTNTSSASSNSSNTPFIGVQAKLNIGKSNDKYEKEADSVADKVVQKKGLFGGEPFFAPAPTIQRTDEGEKDVQKSEDTEQIQEKPLVEKISTLGSGGDDAQPKCDDCAKNDRENSLIQTKCPKCEEKALQTKLENNGSSDSQTSGIEQNLASSKGGGGKMSTETLSEMNQSFGADFGGVNIHTDSKAIQMNRDLGARAFTNGNDIYFNSGEYNPGSADGKHLLAHELTHTVQQGAVSNNIQKASDPCARPENAEAQEECPAEEGAEAQQSNGQQSMMSEASEEPPEGTEEPENDANPVENNQQPSESETPDPEDEVDDTEEVASALEEEDPEAALEDEVEAEPTEGEESEETTEEEGAEEEGEQAAQNKRAAGRQSTVALSEQLAAVEVNKQTEMQNFMVAQETLSGSTKSIESLSTNVQFSKEREENGKKVKADENDVQIANTRGSEFIQSLIDKTSQLSAHSATIESRVLAAVQAQKDRLAFEVTTTKQQIAGQIAQSKAAANERAIVAKTSVESAYVQTALQIEVDAMMAISEMTMAKDGVLTQIDTETVTQSDAIQTIYTEGKGKIEASGAKVGSEATAIGSARSATYLEGKINEWDSWYEGRLTDRRAEARAKAARDVSQSYSEGLINAANEQATAAMEGKQGDLDNVQTVSQQSKDGLTNLFDSLVAQLEASKDEALSNALASRDSAISGIDSGLSQLTESLDEQQRSQFEVLDNMLASKSASLDIVAYQSITSQFEFLSDAILQMRGQIEQIRDMLSGQEVPDMAELDGLFVQISGSVDAGINSMLGQFDQLVTEVELAVQENGNTTVASISSMRAETISSVMKMDQANQESVNQITEGALTSLVTLGGAFTASASQLVIDSVTQFDNIATSMQELLTSAAEGIALRFEQSAGNLESALRCSLRNLGEDITCYANEAASHEAPAWKTVVKWILIIAIVVIVTVFLGPAVIGLAGGLLGSAFAGAVVGGAIVGALAGGAIQVLNNWETNRDLGEGIGKAMLLGAIGGAIGGGVSAALGGTSLGVVSKFAIETVADGLVEVGIGVVTGTFTWENFGMSMLINVGMNLFTSGLSANSRVGATQQRIMHSSGNVGARVTGATNPFPAVPAAGVAPRPNTGDVDPTIRTPETNTRTDANVDAPRTETDAPRTDTDSSAPRTETDAPRTDTDSSAPRTETDAPRTDTDSSAPRTETDAPKTENDSNAPRTESDEPRSTHKDAPEVEEGTGIVAQFRTPDGHTVKVLQDGRIIVCSTCGEIRNLFAAELRADPRLEQRLADIERLPNADTKAEQASQLRQELMDQRIDNSDADLGALEGMGYNRQQLEDGLRNFEGGTDNHNAFLALLRSFGNGPKPRALMDILDGLARNVDGMGDFANRIAAQSTLPELRVNENIDSLLAAHNRGDAVLTQGHLQTGVFPNRPYRINNGVLEFQNPRTGAWTSPPKSYNRKIDFVILGGEGSVMRVVLGGEHTGLSGGARSVVGAGELVFHKNGTITEITNGSGHYRPSLENIRRALTIFRQRGLFPPNGPVTLTDVGAN